MAIATRKPAARRRSSRSPYRRVPIPRPVTPSVNTTVDSTVYPNMPEDEADQIGQPDNTPDTTLVQPPFGAGPKFFSGVIGH